MEPGKPIPQVPETIQERILLEEILGYLNFSSGSENSAFLAALDHMAAICSPLWGIEPPSEVQPAWQTLYARLEVGLAWLSDSSKAFEQIDQAKTVMKLVFKKILPEYLKFHSDLLFHQTGSTLFYPLFIGRTFELVLREEKPWDNLDEITGNVITKLNDFIGHRPVAVLENDRKLEPYPHERLRPIPLWIREVGPETGRYQKLIERTIEVLRKTDPDILRSAWFDPNELDELAIDPRAYDFDHPVNRRPNYQFGQWDPHHIDNRGYYRRYVLQQETLNGIMARIENPETPLPDDEILTEAATVLAGTILMGSGTSGSGPGTHDSETSLAVLLPEIAAYRDRFYLSWLEQFGDKHQERLIQEAKRLRQPLGGARQHLNQYLTGRRAAQLQNVHLALLFARMGYPETARDHAAVVPTASARMQCEIECRMISAIHLIDDGNLDQAARLLAEIEDLLHRSIHCGAMVDPWNLLGFDAQFSPFHTLENSSYDLRVDTLLDLIEDIFSLYARLMREAAAVGDEPLRVRLADDLDSLASWWDQFATTEISSIEGISGHQAWESADRVAVALGAWHKAGTSAGDIKFWRAHVEEFHSPKAYAQVVEALLDQKDLVSAMALLMQWLSETDEIPLIEGNYTFFQLALRWMSELWIDQDESSLKPRSTADDLDRWAMTSKFLDYLEAGSDAFWEVPEFDIGGTLPQGEISEEELLEEEEEGEEPVDHIYDAAYENVVYRDTTNDGFEGEIFDSGDTFTDFELIDEADRVQYRLAFLTMVSNLWTMIACQVAEEKKASGEDDKIAEWLTQASNNHSRLQILLKQIHRHPVPMPSSHETSLAEYDRRLGIKVALLDRTVACCVATTDAIRSLQTLQPLEAEPTEQNWALLLRQVFRDMLEGNTEAIRAKWPKLEVGLTQQPLLYLPLNREGNPQQIVAARTLHHALQDLLRYLPRLGLIYETCRLLETIQRMEQEHPVGQGGITEFNHLFEIGYESVVEAVLHAKNTTTSDIPYLECLETISEPLMRLWIDHSHSIRLSPLEAIDGEQRWRDLREFIRTYGGPLFSQSFMGVGNLRAILHEGVDSYLEWLSEKPDAKEDNPLIADLDGQLPRDKAVALLGTILESILDNYNEYLDYNSSTTQSDHGELLYTLLDFLRLTNRYDRIAWHLQPLVKAHEVLVRAGHLEGAQQWEETFAEQTEKLSGDLLKNYDRLVKAYGMQLRSVSDRLGQRFVRPLAVGRLKALISPAMDEAHPKASASPVAGSTVAKGPSAFEKLIKGLAPLIEQPTGVGFLVPKWLESLQDEADHHELIAEHLLDPTDIMRLPVPRVSIKLNEFSNQVVRWSEDSL
jgi:hypothetical protein